MRENKEVETRLIGLSKQHTPGRWQPEAYIGSEYNYYQYINLKVPHIRAAAKQGYSFSNLSKEKQFTIWQNIWFESTYFEVALSAIHFINQQSNAFLVNKQQNLIRWQTRVDNWALSDELSHCYAKLLEYSTKSLLPQYKIWSASDNPWEVRQSMVGLLYYSRMRQSVLPYSKIISFVKPHLSHKHYYVQKAVGWTLRECWNIYPEQTYAFLTKNAKAIPSGGWTAATEKLSKSDKALLKQIRQT